MKKAIIGILILLITINISFAQKPIKIIKQSKLTKSIKLDFEPEEPEIITIIDTTEKETELDLGADFKSRYIWRGTDFGNSPSIQPFMKLNVGKFEFGAWGSYSSNSNNLQESDLYLTYNASDMFSLTITDYFLSNGTLKNNEYFAYKESFTGHVFEGGMTITGAKDMPLNIYVGTNFYGADAKKSNGKNMYSTYIEVSYNGKIKETDYSLFIGGTPNNADKTKKESGFYADKAGLVNIGINAAKKIKITNNYDLNINFSVIANPDAQNIFFIFGINI